MRFILFEYLFRDRRAPHEGLSIFRQQFKLACPLENENAAAYVVGKFFFFHVRERKRRDERVGVGNFNMLCSCKSSRVTQESAARGLSALMSKT